jgi:hypothetical protein
MLNDFMNLMVEHEMLQSHKLEYENEIIKKDNRTILNLY